MNRMILIVLSLVVAISATFGGCGSLSPNITVSGALTYPGFDTFPTPRTFDGPGSIFRIDEDGRHFPVAQLNVPIEHPGDEAFSEYIGVGNWTLEALAQFIRGSYLGEGGLNAKKFASVVVKLGAGRRERSLGKYIDSAIAKERIDFEWRAGSRYYVVVETISVKDIEYSVFDAAGQSAALRGTFNALLSAGIGVESGRLEGRSLVQRFPEWHRVFYLADEISPPALGVTEAAPKRMLAQKPLVWMSEPAGQ